MTGKAVILGMLLVTLGLSGFAIWYRQHAGRRTRELFGVEHGQRIQLAPQVHLLRLDPPPPQIERAPATGPWKPIAQVSGMTHVRGAMMEDRSFAWTPVEDCGAGWQYLMRFRDGQGETTLALDLECARIRILGVPDGEVSFAPMATFLRRFVNENQ